MQRVVFKLIISVLLAESWGGAYARAELMLSLSSSANLEALSVNQIVSFDVRLSGLANPQELDYLAATISFTDNLWGIPTVEAGAIVPDPLDFLSSTSAGLADAAFLASSSDATNHICTDGIFFTFQTQVLKPGDGRIGFSWVDATEFNASDPDTSIPLDIATGSSLDVRVVSEPTMLFLMTTAATVAAPFFLKRRKP